MPIRVNSRPSAALDLWAMTSRWTGQIPDLEITGTLSGDVSMIAKRTDNPEMEGIDGCYVDIIVDGGEATRVKIPNGTNMVKLVSGLAEGKHTVRVLTANSPAFGTLSVSHVEFTGALDGAEGGEQQAAHSGNRRFDHHRLWSVWQGRRFDRAGE